MLGRVVGDGLSVYLQALPEFLGECCKAGVLPSSYIGHGWCICLEQLRPPATMEANVAMCAFKTVQRCMHADAGGGLLFARLLARLAANESLALSVRTFAGSRAGGLPMTFVAAGRDKANG